MDYFNIVWFYAFYFMCNTLRYNRTNVFRNGNTYYFLL